MADKAANDGELDGRQAMALLKHPAAVQRLNDAVRSLEGGKGVAHAEVLKRLEQGKA